MLPAEAAVCKQDAVPVSSTGLQGPCCTAMPYLDLKLCSHTLIDPSSRCHHVSQPCSLAGHCRILRRGVILLGNVQAALIGWVTHNHLHPADAQQLTQCSTVGQNAEVRQCKIAQGG